MIFAYQNGARVQGCDHCGAPVMTVVKSPAGRVELCWEHTLRSTGWDSERLEAAHRPLAGQGARRSLEPNAGDVQRCWEW